MVKGKCYLIPNHLEDCWMIKSFEDFCTWVYVIVDDIWQRIGGLFRRPGSPLRCSDSELLTIALVSECKGWQKESELRSHWEPYLDLFPHFPERSRFNRRRRNLMAGFNLVRQVVLHGLELAQDHHCLIDSLPVEVIQFHLVPSSSARQRWYSYGASYGRVPAKQQTIFGYKLHLLVTLNGLILDFVLAPAHASEREVAEELLAPYTNLLVMGDKGYLSQHLAQQLQTQQRIRLLALPRRNQISRWPKAFLRLVMRLRQLMESIVNQLADQFHIETTAAHTFWGLGARLHTKLAAHTLCIYLNRLLGKADFLQIKALAFPI